MGALEVSVVGIGCTNFGRELDAAATREVVAAALAHGITFFDTADSYGDPKTQSETFLGEALRPHRDKVVLATKFGRRIDAERGGAKPAYVRAAVEASLRRLQTDRIDLIQLHIPDPDTPIEETLGALADLRAEGKVREIGGSNLDAAQLGDFTARADAAGLPRFAATQIEYNMLHRREVADIVAECRRSGISLLPFRPLYHGLLTGKYRAGAPVPEGSRIGGKGAERQSQLLSERNLAAVEALTRFAEERGHNLLELAFAWLLAHPEIPSIIAGVSSPRQVASNAAAAAWELDPVSRGELAALLEDIA
nr:aldo/keto reductase [Novosphingobium flavum]